MVSVTGKRKLLSITLPVLEDTAEVEYHSTQRETKRNVSNVGVRNDGIENGRGDGDLDGTGGCAER